MTRIEKSYKFFSANGFKFLIFELIIVFLGVYGAFLFQSYSESKKLESEKEKIMIGLKADLEYFRIFFPGFASSMNTNISKWDELLTEQKYEDFSSWRFIQPQYDYTVVEYALNVGAELIDFEMNSLLSQLYTELEKLRQAEELITLTAQNYKAVPANVEQTSEIQMAHQNNLLNLKRLRDRAEDRVKIMGRVASLSEENLKLVNAEFSLQQLREVELLLIKKRGASATEQEKQFYLNILGQYFPNLTKEEIKEALE